MSDAKEFPCPHCGSKKRFHKKNCPKITDTTKLINDAVLNYQPGEMPDIITIPKEQILTDNEGPKPIRECCTCEFYVQNPNLGIKECHRFPPEFVTKWPVVGASDWCGEWEKK